MLFANELRLENFSPENEGPEVKTARGWLEVCFGGLTDLNYGDEQLYSELHTLLWERISVAAGVSLDGEHTAEEACSLVSAGRQLEIWREVLEAYRDHGSLEPA